MRLCPTPCNVHTSAQELMRLRRWEEAATAYTQALELQPDNPVILANRSVVVAVVVLSYARAHCARVQPSQFIISVLHRASTVTIHALEYRATMPLCHSVSLSMSMSLCLSVYVYVSPSRHRRWGAIVWHCRIQGRGKHSIASVPFGRCRLPCSVCAGPKL